MSVDEMVQLTDAAEHVTSKLPHGQALGCTELQAAWCEIHGDCTCPQDKIRIYHNPDCPLHGAEPDIWGERVRRGRGCDWAGCQAPADYHIETLDIPNSVCEIHWEAMCLFNGPENVRVLFKYLD